MRLSCVGCLRRFIPVDDSLGVRPLLGDVGWGSFLVPGRLMRMGEGRG